MNVPIHICASIIDALSILIQRPVTLVLQETPQNPDHRSYKLVTEDHYIVLKDI